MILGSHELMNNFSSQFCFPFLSAGGEANYMCDYLNLTDVKSLLQWLL